MYEYDWNILLVIENWTKNCFWIHNRMGILHLVFPTNRIFSKNFRNICLYILWLISTVCRQQTFRLFEFDSWVCIVIEHLRGIYKHHRGVVLRRKLLKGNSTTFIIAIEHNSASSYKLSTLFIQPFSITTYSVHLKKGRFWNVTFIKTHLVEIDDLSNFVFWRVVKYTS